MSSTSTSEQIVSGRRFRFGYWDRSFLWSAILIGLMSPAMGFSYFASTRGDMGSLASLLVANLVSLVVLAIAALLAFVRIRSYLEIVDSKRSIVISGWRRQAVVPFDQVEFRLPANPGLFPGAIEFRAKSGVWQKCQGIGQGQLRTPAEMALLERELRERDIPVTQH